MFKPTTFKPGKWNVICDVCGRKYKATDLKKRWDGLMVCSEDWEMRHPQDLIRPIKERNSVPWTRPRPTDIDVVVCSVTDVSSIVGVGVVGCMMVGFEGASDGYTPDQLENILYPPTFNPNTL